MIDPATGALQLTPAYRDKCAKALMREVRRMKLRLYFTFARLYLQKFMLECRSAAVGIRGQVSARNRSIEMHVTWQTLSQSII